MLAELGYPALLLYVAIFVFAIMAGGTAARMAKKGRAPPDAYHYGVAIQASLAAFVKLGRAKGYRLVGVQSLGFNAFFVRDGLGEDLLPERTPAECFASTPRLRHCTDALSEQLLSEPWWEEV